MKQYKLYYTTENGRVYSIEGTFSSSRPCLPKVFQAVDTLDEYNIRHIEIKLYKETQRGAETGGIGGG